MLSGVFEELIGVQLSSVEFIHDYFQMRFDSACVTVFNPAIVETLNVSVASGDAGFRALLLSQVGRVVSGVKFLENEILSIQFESSTKVTVSLSDDDYQGPEAIIYKGKNSDLPIIL